MSWLQKMLGYLYLSAAWAAMFKELLRVHKGCVPWKPTHSRGFWSLCWAFGGSCGLCSTSLDSRVEIFCRIQKLTVQGCVCLSPCEVGQWHHALKNLPDSWNWRRRTCFWQEQGIELRVSGNWNCWAIQGWFSNLLWEGNGSYKNWVNAIEIRLFSCFV